MKAQTVEKHRKSCRSTAGITRHTGGHPDADGAENTGRKVEGNKGTFAEVRRGEALGGEAGGLPGADAGSAGAVMGNTHCFPHLPPSGGCPARLPRGLEEQFKDEPGGSVYAEEGTAAHALAEHKLKKALKKAVLQAPGVLQSHHNILWQHTYLISL